MLPHIAVAGSPDDVVSGLAEFVRAGRHPPGLHAGQPLPIP